MIIFCQRMHFSAHIKKYALLIFSSIFWSPLLCGQISQTIRGNVLDKESHTAIVGAYVYATTSNSSNACVSDSNGNFKLIVPVGRNSITVKYVGYEDVIVSELIVMSGKEVFLTIEMREKISTVEEVVVKANTNKLQAINSMAVSSVRQLSSEDASRYASGFNDPSRMVSSFAGVGAVEGDGVNDIVIRGNSPRGLLWRLEGIEIPNPNHFTDGQGASGGALSIITSNVLTNFDFYTGAFPAEYGNAFSGIMDLALRKGNNNRREYAFQASVVGMETSLEGPFKTGHPASYLVNLRYSTFALLSQMHLIDLGNNNLAPKFQDLTFNLTFPTQHVGTFSMFGVGGKSATGTVPIRNNINWDDATNWDARYDETENHEMAVVGIKHMVNLSNKKTYFKTVVAASRQFDAWSSGYLTDPDTRQMAYNDHFANASLRAHVLVNHKMNAKHTLRAGIIYSKLLTDMFQRQHNWHTGADTIRVNKTNSTDLDQLYFQWQYRITDRIAINSGLHAMFLALNNTSALEPRVGMKWQYGERQSFSFGLGMHSRTEAIASYFANVRLPNGTYGEGNRNNGFTKSLQSVLGYDKTWNYNIHLKAEAYYQYLYNIPVVDTLNSTTTALNFSYGLPDWVMPNKGIGYSKGVEVTIEKSYADNYYFLATVSVFDSKYKANNGIWYHTYYSNNFITNLLGGYEYKINQNVLGINLKVLYRKGFRYTPLDIPKSIAKNDEVFVDNKLFSKHLPDFIRLDAGLNFRKNNPSYSWTLSLDVQNVINRPNVIAYAYDSVLKNQKSIVGMGLIPILNYRVEF